MERLRRVVLTMLLMAGFVVFAGPEIASATVPTVAIHNDTVWKDTSGNEIKAQGGSILKVGSTYYWAGTQLDNGSYAFQAVNLYKSTDLMTWTFDKSIFTPRASGDLASGNWVGRPDLLYNSSTSKYVIVVEIYSDGSAGPGNKMGFATSSSVDGTYTYLGSTLVNGNTTGDHSVYVEGSNAYLMYLGDSATTRNVSVNIAPLSASWTSIGSPIFTEASSTYEAPSIIKVGSTYEWLSSGTNNWSSTATSYRTSTNLTAWSAWATVPTTPSTSNSFNSQTDFVIPVVGSSRTSYIYAADRYTNFPGYNTGIGRNVWYPLTFSGTTPTIHGDTDFTVDVGTGVIAENYVSNGRFDQSAQTALPQVWNTWGSSSASYSQNGGVTGVQLVHYFTSSYSVWTYQDISLPNGTYTLTASVKSSGGQTAASLGAKNYGGSDLNQSLNTSIPSWTVESFSFTVTTGQVEIGVWSNASGSQWLNVDDISLWKT